MPLGLTRSFGWLLRTLDDGSDRTLVDSFLVAGFLVLALIVLLAAYATIWVALTTAIDRSVPPDDE